MANPANPTGRRIKHGLSHTALYKSWWSMMQRCYNPLNKRYAHYGGRGIRVCEFLRATPANLYSVIGEKPSPELTIDRIDNNGSYTCGICAECLKCGYTMNLRWATDTEQNRNKRTTLMITAEGKTQSLAAWAEEKGIHKNTLRKRFHGGFDLFVPLHPRHPIKK